MAELDDALNSILSSPQEMEKIMGLARELSGSLGIGGGGEETAKATPSPMGGLDALDPKLIGVITRVMSEYSSRSNDKQKLADALKPYLKEERKETLDRAVKIASLAHVAKAALGEFGGDFHL